MWEICEILYLCLINLTWFICDEDTAVGVKGSSIMPACILVKTNTGPLAAWFNHSLIITRQVCGCTLHHFKPSGYTHFTKLAAANMGYVREVYDL